MFRQFLESLGLLAPIPPADPKDEWRWVASVAAKVSYGKGEDKITMYQWYYLLWVNGHGKRKCTLSNDDYHDWKNHPRYTCAVLPWLKANVKIDHSICDSYDPGAGEYIWFPKKEAEASPEPEKEDDGQLEFCFENT